MSSSDKERAGYHHGDLRAALVEHARVLVEERGVEALSLREVARRAGVSRAAPYHHFRNKEAMVAAVAVDGFDRLSASMQAISVSGDGMCGLEACGRAYIAFALDNPTLYRLMFGTKFGRFAEHPDLKRSAKCAFALLVEQIAPLYPEGTELKSPAMAVWSAVHGMASLIIDEQGPYDVASPDDVERWITALMELIGSGLGPER